MVDIERVRRCLYTMLELHAKRPSVLPIIKRLVDEIEKAEAMAAADLVARARAMIAAA